DLAEEAVELALHHIRHDRPGARPVELETAPPRLSSRAIVPPPHIQIARLNEQLQPVDHRWWTAVVVALVLIRLTVAENTPHHRAGGRWRRLRLGGPVAAGGEEEGDQAHDES